MMRYRAIAILILTLSIHVFAGDVPSPAEPYLGGRVMNLAGRGLGGVQVVAIARSLQSDVTAKTVTDERGEFAFPDMRSGVYDLTLTHSDYCESHIVSIEIGERSRRRIEVRMVPAVTLRGRVLKTNGEPVPSAEVRFSVAPGSGVELPAECRRQVESTPNTKTDPTGRFVLGDLAVCQGGVLKVLHPDFPPHTRVLEQSALSKGRTLDLQIELRPGGVLVGRVTDQNREPIPGASVQLLNLREGLEAEEGELRAETEPDGKFRISRIPRGVYRARIEAVQCVPEVRDGVNIEPGVTAQIGDVRMTRGATITGKVLTPSGDGAVNAVVQAYLRYSNVRRRASSTKTDSTGSFVLSGLQPGRYDLRAESTNGEGGAVELGDVEPPSDDVELVLEQTGALQGRVVCDDVQALESVTLTAHIVESGALGGAQEGALEFDKVGGNFRIGQLTENDYVVVARARDRSPTRSAVVTVEPGRTSDAGELVLLGGVSLSGRVLDSSDGSAIVGAAVTCEMNEGVTGCATASSGVNGDFRIGALSPGTAQLLVQHPDYAAHRFLVEVAEGDTELAELHLSRGATIFGVVRESNGAGVPNVVIEAGPHGGPWTRAWTDGGGAYRLEHLKEGRVYLRRLSGLGAFEEVDGREVNVDLGEVRREDFVLGTSVFGEVRRSGAVIPFARVSVSRPTGSGATLASTSLASASTWTDSEGAYRIAAAPTGKVLVTVESDGRLTTQRAEIPETSPFRLDLELPGHPITGVVRDEEAGSLLAGAMVRVAQRAGGGDNLMILTSSSPVEGGEVVVAGSAEVTQASSQADGSFTLWVSEPGTYELIAQATGYSPRQVSAATSQRVVIELRRGGTIAGRVVGPQMRSEDFSFACLLSGETRSCKGVQGPQFSFEMVDPGSYGVVVAVANKGLAKQGNVLVGPGENDPLVLALQPAPDVTVQVGSDEAGARLVSLVDSTGSDLLPILRMASLEPVRVEATAEHESAFVVRGLPGGTYALGLMSQGRRWMVDFTTGIVSSRN